MGRFTPRLLSAVVTPLILLAPLAANAQATEPRRVFGDTPLTEENDQVVNDKTIDLTEDSDFGNGNDTLTNTGTITIGANRTSPITINLTSLETLKNQGMIDMRNGHVGDVLHLSTDYTGERNARLGLDVGHDGADKLVVDSIAYGETLIVLGGLNAQNATLTGEAGGPILVQAGAGTKGGAFRIENNEIGLIRYGLLYDDTAKTYRLLGVAGQRAYETLKISEGITQIWRRSADAWSAHTASLRDTGGGDGGGVWAQAHGQSLDRDDSIPGIGRNVSVSYSQNIYGGQMGVDLVNDTVGETDFLLGVTGGYSNSRMKFSGAAAQSVKLDGFNVGGYAALAHNGYFFNALAKLDRQSVKVRGETAIPDFDVTSYGGMVEVGGRSDEGGLGYEQVFSLSYTTSKLDDMTALAQHLNFANATGFLAKAGVRGSAENEVFGGALTFQGGVFVAHDFTVKNEVTLVSGANSERLIDKGSRTFGQLSLGMTFEASGGFITFLEANGDYGGGRQGGGMRLGARYAF